MDGGESVSFLEYILSSKLRFYQERDVVLDLYHSGFSGIAVGCLAAASATVFLLAIFHIIPKRTHIVRLFLGLGGLALLVGFAGTYSHHAHLEEVAPKIIKAMSVEHPNYPKDMGQEAAIVALPLIVGAGVLAGNLLGCLYMALFWGGSLIARKRTE